MRTVNWGGGGGVRITDDYVDSQPWKAMLLEHLAHQQHENIRSIIVHLIFNINAI